MLNPDRRPSKALLPTAMPLVLLDDRPHPRARGRAGAQAALRCGGERGRGDGDGWCSLRRGAVTLAGTSRISANLPL